MKITMRLNYHNTLIPQGSRHIKEAAFRQDNLDINIVYYQDPQEKVHLQGVVEDAETHQPYKKINFEGIEAEYAKTALEKQGIEFVSPEEKTNQTLEIPSDKEKIHKQLKETFSKSGDSLEKAFMRKNGITTEIIADAKHLVIVTEDTFGRPFIGWNLTGEQAQARRKEFEGMGFLFHQIDNNFKE